MRDDLQSIVSRRAEQNNKRRREVVTRLGTLLGKAQFVVRGQIVDVGGEDPAGRVIKGFQALLDQVYPDLAMLRGVSYTEAGLTKNYEQAKDGLFGDGGSADLTEAEQAVFNAIIRDKTKGLRATIKTVVERFEKKPYGWPLAAIQNQLAILAGRGKIEAKTDSNPVEGNNFIAALKNTHGFGQVILEPQVEFSPVQVRQLTDFHNSFFNDVTSINDAKTLALDTIEKLKNERQALEILHATADKYPFLDQLEPVIGQLKDISAKPYQWLLEDLSKVSDDLLDAKENVVAPIRAFMEGSQKDIYDSAHTFLCSEDANFHGELKAEAQDIRLPLEGKGVFRGGTMQALKSKLEALQAKVKANVDHERTDALKTIDGLKSRFEAEADFKKLNGDQQAKFRNVFDAISSQIRSAPLIAVIRDHQRQFQDSEYPTILGQMMRMAEGAGGMDDGNPSDQKSGEVAEAKIIPVRSVYVAPPKAILANEADLDGYLSALREAVLEEIKSGKKVSV